MFLEGGNGPESLSGWARPQDLTWQDLPTTGKQVGPSGAGQGGVGHEPPDASWASHTITCSVSLHVGQAGEGQGCFDFLTHTMMGDGRAGSRVWE